MAEKIIVEKIELTRLFKEFINSETAGGVVLIIVTITSLLVANYGFGASYTELWNYNVAGHSIVHWINDGLMTIFFLLIGLELEREFYRGELSNLRTALLPVFGALGGMILPAAIFIAINFGKESISGTGIPMATDIAFAIGILSLLGSRIPASLKVFLTALAVFDDLGAIIIIAIFYTVSLSFTNLFLALAVFIFLIILNRAGVRKLILYAVPGILMWYFMSESGVHASIAGVLLAFVIPFGDGSEKSPSFRLQHHLHRPVAFIIMPLFALANTCIILGDGWNSGLTQPLSLGIIAGLVFGKPLGIILFSMIAVRLRLSALPVDMQWKHIAGAGMLGGIGFTMSIFIALVGMEGAEMIDHAKISILIASVVSGLAGYIWLRVVLLNQKII